MSILHILDHPLLQHKLTWLRNQETGSRDFRQLTREIAMLMTYEITRDFPLTPIEIETPLCKTTSMVLAGKKVAIVPGCAFGQSGEGFVRVSYAYSIDHIKKALSAIGRFLETAVK